MAKTFTKLTRPALRKLAANNTLTEHGIIFDRLKDGDGRYSISDEYLYNLFMGIF